MNAARRKEIARAQELLSTAAELVSDAKDIIEQAKDEEREYFDNMPESLQGGEKGQQADAAATALKEVYDTLNDLDFRDFDSKLDDAAQ